MLQTHAERQLQQNLSIFRSLTCIRVGAHVGDLRVGGGGCHKSQKILFAFEMSPGAAFRSSPPRAICIVFVINLRRYCTLMYVHIFEHAKVCIRSPAEICLQRCFPALSLDVTAGLVENNQTQTCPYNFSLSLSLMCRDICIYTICVGMGDKM